MHYFHAYINEQGPYSIFIYQESWLFIPELDETPKERNTVPKAQEFTNKLYNNRFHRKKGKDYALKWVVLKFK
jgi:hypothetical protein